MQREKEKDGGKIDQLRARDAGDDFVYDACWGEYRIAIQHIYTQAEIRRQDAFMRWRGKEELLQIEIYQLEVCNRGRSLY